MTSSACRPPTSTLRALLFLSPFFSTKEQKTIVSTGCLPSETFAVSLLSTTLLCVGRSVGRKKPPGGASSGEGREKVVSVMGEGGGGGRRAAREGGAQAEGESEATEGGGWGGGRRGGVARATGPGAAGRTLDAAEQHPLPSSWAWGRSRDSEMAEPRFTFVELFAGIGGFRLGLEALGGQCVFSCEYSKMATHVLRHNFATCVEAGDVKGVSPYMLPHHDLLVGGFPCQSFSNAGACGGFGDERGALFHEMCRLAKACQPKACLLYTSPSPRD